MGLVLRATPQDGDAIEIRLTSDEKIVGRSRECDISIADPLLSGTHCSFYIEQGKACIKDLGSTNGCTINQLPVEQSFIFIGDQVKIGSTFLSLIEEKMSEEEREAHFQNHDKTQVTFVDITREDLGLSIRSEEKAPSEQTTFTPRKPHFSNRPPENKSQKKKSLLDKIKEILKI